MSRARARDARRRTKPSPHPELARLLAHPLRGDDATTAVSACGVKTTGGKLLLAAFKENRSLVDVNLKQNKLQIPEKQAILMLIAGMDGRLNVDV